MQMSQRKSRHRIAPVTRDLGRRAKNELATAQLRVGDKQAPVDMAPAAPEQYIKIECPLPPALAFATPAESMLDRVGMRQHGRGRQVGTDQAGSICIFPGGWPNWLAADDVGHHFNLAYGCIQPLSGLAEDLCRRSESHVPHVRAEPDQIVLAVTVRHGGAIRYLPPVARKAADADHGRSPCPRGAWQRASGRVLQPKRRSPRARTPRHSRPTRHR